MRYADGVDAGPKHSDTEVTDESGVKTRSYTDLFGNEVKTVRGAQLGSRSTTVLGYNVLGQRLLVTDPRGLDITYGMSTRGLLVRRDQPRRGNGPAQVRCGRQRALLAGRRAGDCRHGALPHVRLRGTAARLGCGHSTFSTLDPDVAPADFQTDTVNWHTVRKYAKPLTTSGHYPWTSFSTQINGVTLSNVAGRLAAVASKSNGAWQVTLYSYDTRGAIDSTFTFTQNNAGNAVLTAINTKSGYQRNLRGEITKRTTTVGASSFFHWYDYDNRGLIEKVFTATSDSKPGSADVTYTFGVDGAPITRQFSGDASIPFTYTIRGQLRTISSQRHHTVRRAVTRGTRTAPSRSRSSGATAARTRTSAIATPRRTMARTSSAVPRTPITTAAATRAATRTG